MAKYDELDARILNELVELTPVFELWMRLKDFSRETENITLIDRRLQALKKKGKVMNVRCFGWKRVGSE
jgi:hypothetical protein